MGECFGEEEEEGEEGRGFGGGGLLGQREAGQVYRLLSHDHSSMPSSEEGADRVRSRPGTQDAALLETFRRRLGGAPLHGEQTSLNVHFRWRDMTCRLVVVFSAYMQNPVLVA